MKRTITALFLYFTLFSMVQAQLTQITSFSGSQLKPNSVTQVGDRIFFEADDGIHGNELWVYDLITASYYMIADINPTGGTNVGGNIIAFGNGVLFRGTDGINGQELFFSDGTPEGTFMVKDINPAGSSFPEDLFEFNGEVYFAANDGTSGKELWKTDGTPAGTALVKDINPGNGTGLESNTSNMFGQNGSYLFFRADDGTHGKELWISDGTTAGTQMVEDLFPGSGNGLGETEPQHAAIFLNTLFFRGNDGGTSVGKELHYFDTTDETIKLWKEINIGPNAQADIKNLFVAGGKLFFRAKFGSSGVEPWVNDGTVEGTQLIKQLRQGSGSSNPLYQIENPVTGEVFFQANGGNGNEPWISDGTATGTRQIANLFAGNGGSGPSFFAFKDDFAYFTAQTAAQPPFGEAGRELFATDGNDIFLVADINEGPNGSNPGSAAPIITSDGRIFFATQNTGFGSNLYAYSPQQFMDIPSFDPFGNVNAGQASAPQSFVINYTHLSNPVTILADDGFELAVVGSGSFTPDSITLFPDAAGNIDTTVLVRFSPVVPGNFEKTLTIKGQDVVTVRAALNGLGITPQPENFFVFDDFFGAGLPDGWNELNTTGRVFVQDNRLTLFYDPGQPVAAARRSFGPATGTVHIGFIFNSERNSINVPVFVKNSLGEVIAQLRFNNGIKLVTSVDTSGNPTATVNLISENSVPRGVDHQVVLKIDLGADVISMEVNRKTVPEAQEVPLLLASEDIASFEISVLSMFDIGNVFLDDLLIGPGNKFYLRQKIVQASELLTASSVGTSPGDFPASARTILQDAITAAIDAFVDGNLSQAMIDQNEASLQGAIETFLDSRIRALATVTIDTQTGHDITEGTFGYNNRSVDQAWTYRNPEFVEALRAGKAGWMRYLSGTISDPFNMNTGTYELEWIDQFRKVPNQVTAHRRVEAKGPQLVYDLYQALGEVGGKLIVTWPGFMGDPEEVSLFAKFCKDNHINVEYWQLNNEPFFFMPGRNHYFYNNGTDYAAKMKPLSDAIKSSYPGALTSPSASWGVDIEGGFSAQVRDFTPRFWDIYSMHSYAAFNNSNPPEDVALKNGNAGLQIGGTDAPLKIRNSFGTDMPYIVTEYNVFNNTLGQTFYSGLYNAEYLMRNTAFPNAKHLGLHVFNVNVVDPVFNHNSLLEAAFRGDIELNADTIDYDFNIAPAGSAIILAGEALNRSNFSWDTQVTGGEIVLASHPNSQVDNIPAIYANSYRGTYDKDYILLTNKSDIPHDITIEGINLPDNVIRTIVSSAAPLAKDGFGPETDTLDLSGGIVTIPGYSVCRLEWNAGLKTPLAPRIFKASVTNGGVDLKWWERDNADGYTIYYGADPSQLNESVVINGAGNNSYTLPLPKYRITYIAVSAFNAIGEGPRSGTIDTKVAKPRVPKLVKTHVRNGSVTLLWASVPYASGYRILYGTSKWLPDQEVDARNASGFTVKGLMNDVTYYFRVVAYNGEGQSRWSNILPATPKAQVPFAPHDLRGSESSDGDVSLQWTVSDSSYNAAYNIFRSREPWTNYQLIANQVSGNSFTDTTNHRQGNHYYIVKAENNSAESFYPSNMLTVSKAKGKLTDELSLEYRIGGSANDNQLICFFRINNDSEVDIPYADITLRYWFTAEGSAPLNLYIDYARLGKQHIQSDFVELDPVLHGADTYFELNFDETAGTLASGASSGTIQLRVAKSDWSSFNENDDHSFLQTYTWREHDQVTLYQKGILAWGSEPPVMGQGVFKSEESVDSGLIMAFPNPFSELLTVVIPDNLENSMMEFRDMNGLIFHRERVKAGRKVLTVTRGLKPGVYVLRFISKDMDPVNFKVLKGD